MPMGNVLPTGDILGQYLDPAFTYRFTGGPEVVRSKRDAWEDGLNCIALSHLVLSDLFDYALPPELHCAEMYTDNSHFTHLPNLAPGVPDLTAMRRGDLVWFGRDDAPIAPEEFEPAYREGKLVNWADFPVKHTAIFTGLHDSRSHSPLLMHATHHEGGVAVWPLSAFGTGEFKRYERLFDVTRLVVSV